MSATYSSFHYSLINQVEGSHFWFAGRNRLIRAIIHRFLPKLRGLAFLEVGFGTGIVLQLVEEMGFKVWGIDVNHQALAFARCRTGANLARQSFYSYRLKPRFDAVGAFDVLEHQAQDEVFLRRCYRLLKPGGYLILTVPAGPKLWSSIDEISGHKRRYSHLELLAKVQRAGFAVVFWNYWQVITLPLFFMWRVWVGRHQANRQPHTMMKTYLNRLPWFVNQALYLLLVLEQGLVFRCRFPAGASLILCAQRGEKP